MVKLDSLEATLADIWAPRVRPSALEWAQQNIILDRRFSPRPGRYDVTYTPYLAQLHEWFSDPKIREVTLVKGAQLGGTTWLANCIMWAIAEEPGPVLYVTSTQDNAKSWSERELLPRLKACEALKPFLPVDEDDFRKVEMHFTTCTLRLVGSNSEANLASRPTRYLFCDEVEKWPDQSTREAPALDLAKARTNFYRAISKIVITSTPTVETGAIWKEYLLGSQHRFEIPCPHCGHHQPLVFEQIKWPQELKDLLGAWDLDAVARSAWYECDTCKGAWPQAQQHELVRRGVWRATNPKAPADHISAHISALYSPQIGWGDIAKLFLQKKNTAGGLHDFYNNYLGLPFRQAGTEVEEEHLVAHREEYDLGTIPSACGKPAAILLGADHQQAFTNYVVRAFSVTGESWLLDYGRVASPEDLVAWATAQRYRVVGDPAAAPAYKISGGLIDSGYATEHIYRTCLEAHRVGFRLLPSKGSGERFITKPVRVTDMSVGSRVYNRSLVIYSDNDFKRHLYIDILRDQKQPWWFPSAVGTDYTGELMRERMVTVQDKRGYESVVWKRYGANHYADAEKLALVMWQSR
jgi:phage terminase large subunit GpA-like protein